MSFWRETANITVGDWSRSAHIVDKRAVGWSVTRDEGVCGPGTDRFAFM
jgi:hypothetical protein